jgi:hypothetical protein
MKLVVVAVILLSFCSETKKQKNKWVSLFDGKSLDGWKVGNNAASFFY